jgi:flagellar biosynthetic protein FliO
MDTVSMIGRLLVSLAAVLGIMWLLARRMRKGGRMKDTRLIDVLGRQQLSRNASVAVVRVGEQALVIGVTDAQVSVLGETDLGAAQAMVAASNSSAPAKRAVARTATSTAKLDRAPGSNGRHAEPADASASAEPSRRKTTGLSGSALSPQTWRQTVESLRDLTSRSA